MSPLIQNGSNGSNPYNLLAPDSVTYKYNNVNDYLYIFLYIIIILYWLFECSQGLGNLIFLKFPKLYTKNDIETYKSI